MKNHLEAAIIDLDGVITQTASTHAKAWNKLFDQYNERRRKEGKSVFTPFDRSTDYPKHIDGIPRYDGVRNFLASRGVSLPQGHPDDEPDTETICGLGNWKNEIFLEMINRDGVQVIEKNIERIKEWKEKGIKTAVISSSANCKKMLEVTRIEHLFDARVDGVVSRERGIRGKPEPDIFLEAAKDLNIEPSRALIVEDSLAGVEAGKKGRFGLVVGVHNSASREDLLHRGADQVVDTLDQLNLDDGTLYTSNQLPSALDHFETIREQMGARRPFIFLDFDGTLAPIVEHHQDAALSVEMKHTIERLANQFPVAVISGRGLADVRDKVNIPDILYAGSHGFEMSGPDGFQHEHQEASDALPVLEKVEKELTNKLGLIEGARLERKKYALAVHYRQVEKEFEHDVIELVSDTIAKYNKVKAGFGKKVVEVKPNVDWHKGRALQLLLNEMPAGEHGKPFAIYIGDDITDEDAFQTLSDGVGILVGDHGGITHAHYHLEDDHQVKSFLEKLSML